MAAARPSFDARRILARVVDAARRHRRRLLSTALALAVVGGALALRLYVVAGWHAPAGDGLQYYALSQTLLREHKLAFAPDLPPQYSRLPGYPLFLAAVVHDAHASLDKHLWIAAKANVYLDLASALLVFFMLRDRRLGRGAAWAAFVAVVVCPMLIFLSTYGLSESLATFLTTLTLFCALRARDGNAARNWALAAGAACGLLQLVRIDGCTILPAVALALYFGATTWRARLLRGALFAIGALVVFAPWPIRNYELFGAPHPEGTAWMRQDGQPLPLGMMRWMRTWGTGEWGQDFPLLKVANDGYLKVDRGGILLPAMYDSDAEKARVIDLFERYNHSRLGLTPDIDADFAALAAERLRRAPFRTLVTLPLHRFVAEWTPMPEWELPMRSRFLRLPSWRRAYNAFERALFALAFAGALALWRRDRRFVAIIVAVVGARAALHAIAHPFPVERYMVESFPAMMALTGVAVALAGQRLLRRWLPAGERARDQRQAVLAPEQVAAHGK